MPYDWYDDIDQIGWSFQDGVQQATASRSESLGMAPSAGDELRAQLKRVAAVPPLQLVEEAESTDRASVAALIIAISTASVESAVSRGSRHITRDDVRAAIQAVGRYPFVRS